MEYVDELRAEITRRLSNAEQPDDEQVRRVIDRVIFESEARTSLSVRDRVKLKTQLFDSIRRLDILSEYLDDDCVTEIMVNGPKDIFIERDGQVIRIDKVFAEERVLSDLIQQIVAGVNRRVNEASPVVDARLSDGSRVNIVLKPIALDGPVMTIRKFSKHRLSMASLVENNTLSAEVCEFLKTLVQSRYNIFISGGTASGKTTLLNCLSEYIGADERVVTIEDSAELRLQGIENLVRLETRNAETEGVKQISIRDLIRQALRMRPDRIIVGEVRGAEALDLLQAMNTGHDGSLSTGHANSPVDMIRRLETMTLMSEVELPLIAVRGQIASAIDIIVQVERLRDGSRRVVSVDEVADFTDGEIELNNLYSFVSEGEENGHIKGCLRSSGGGLKNTWKLEKAGMAN